MDNNVQTLRVRAVIAYDDAGHFVIHGSESETPEEMAKAIQPIWNHNPCTECIDYIEFDMLVPAQATRPRAQVLSAPAGAAIEAGAED